MKNHLAKLFLALVFCLSLLCPVFSMLSIS